MASGLHELVRRAEVPSLLCSRPSTPCRASLRAPAAAAHRLVAQPSQRAHTLISCAPGEGIDRNSCLIFGVGLKPERALPPALKLSSSAAGGAVEQ